jgi:hypothetical protein
MNVKARRVFCSVLGHKWCAWKISVENGLVVSISLICERCGHEETTPIDDGRVDIAVRLALMALDRGCRK